MLERHDWKFETFGDRVLTHMLQEVKDWANNVISKNPTFLTLSGPTETGKTHLLTRAYSLMRKVELGGSPSYPPVMFIKFYETVGILLDIKERKQHWDNIKNCKVLIIEEFLSFRKMNDWAEIAIEKAHEILDVRLGRPTLIDTNKLIAEIEQIDIRIASRLRRNNGVILEIPKNTPQFLTRKRNAPSRTKS